MTTPQEAVLVFTRIVIAVTAASGVVLVRKYGTDLPAITDNGDPVWARRGGGTAPVWLIVAAFALFADATLVAGAYMTSGL